MTWCLSSLIPVFKEENYSQNKRGIKVLEYACKLCKSILDNRQKGIVDSDEI